MLGPWQNDGTCQGTGKNPACGPGIQLQKRACTDGTLEKCTDPADTQRSVSCGIAGSRLPDCPPGRYPILSLQEYGRHLKSTVTDIIIENGI